MNILEAYELALEKAEELKKEGIKVEVTPYALDEAKKVVSEKTMEERLKLLPIDKWVNVHFSTKTDAQCDKIHTAANYLGLVGMSFDTGGSGNERDWELDWSFIYSGKEDEQWREAREESEELIKEEAKKKKK